MTRASLLDALLGILSDARGGSTSIVLLKGEAGLGKSWLADSFRQQLDDYAPVVTGRPLFPAVLRAAFPLLHRDRDAGLLQAAATLRPGGPWDGHNLPAAVSVKPERAVLDLADALGRAARRQGGMCLTLEDAHEWPSDEQQSFSRFWLRLLAIRAPMLVVLTARQADAAWWGALANDCRAFGGRTPVELVLGPLGESDQLQLTREFLHGLDHPPELDSWLAERANGHPLHQLELLRFLLQGASLLRDEVTWKFRPPPDELLPRGVSRLLARRVSELPPGPSRQVLRLVALLGRDVGLDEAERMLGTDRMVLLEQLQSGREWLLRHQLRSGEVTIGLEHPLVGPEVRRGMSAAETRELHGLILKGTTLAGERARHARILQVPAAPELTRAALEDAVSAGRPADVIEACEALLPAAGGAERLRLLELAASRSQQIGDPQKALRFALCGDSPTLWHLRMELYGSLGRYEEALATSRLICGDDPVPNHAAVRSQQLYFLVQLGELEQADALARELLQDDRLNDAERALLLVRQSQATKYLVSYHAAYAQCSQAAAILRRDAPESRELLVALGNQAGLGALSGHWAEAEKALVEAIGLAEQLVLPQYLPMLHANRAFLLWISGRYQDAGPAMLACLRLSSKREMDYVKAVSLWNYGRWLLSGGQPEAAIRTLRQSLALGGASGPDLAEALALAGETIEAQEQLSGVINEENCYSHPHSRAIVWLCRNRPDRATEELSRHDPRTAHPAHEARHQLLMAVAHSLTGQIERVREHLDRASGCLAKCRHEPLQAELDLACFVLGGAPESTGRQAVSKLEALAATGHLLLYRRLFPKRVELLGSTRLPPGAGAAPVYIRTLGGLELPHVHWRGRQARELLSHLVVGRLSGGTPVRRKQLLLSLWPDSEPERAATSLRVTLQRLRRTLGAPAAIVRKEHDELELHGVITDAELFAQAYAEGDPGHAITWYTGDFLPESDHADAAVLRERLRSDYRTCLLELAAQPPSETTREHLARALEDDPLDLELTIALLDQLKDLPTERRRLLESSRSAYRAELGEVPQALQRQAQ